MNARFCEYSLCRKPIPADAHPRRTTCVGQRCKMLAWTERELAKDGQLKTIEHDLIHGTSDIKNPTGIFGTPRRKRTNPNGHTSITVVSRDRLRRIEVLTRNVLGSTGYVGPFKETAELRTLLGIT